MPHQQKILERTKDKDRFAIYAKAGLGKSFIALYDWYYNSGKKNLIVATMASLLKNWEEEIKLASFTDIVFLKLNKGTIKSMKEMRECMRENKRGIYIVSHNSMWRMEELLWFEEKDFGIVIDESHKIKNRGSKQSKFAVALSRKYNWIRLLTGTPMSIGWEDYIIPLKILKEEDPLVNTIKSFKENFMNIEFKKNYTNNISYEVVNGYKNIEKLKSIIEKTAIYIDEKKAGIILPEQIEKYYYIEQNFIILKAMRDKVYGTWMVLNSGTKMMAYRTALSGFLYGENKFGERVIEKFPDQPKKNMFKEIISNIDKKVLVFYNFKQELEDIKEICKELKKKFSRVESKNIDLNGDIVASHYTPGSHGHNFQQFFDTVIYYSPTIVGSDFIQTKKRIHRIGQEKTTYYYYLITKNSIEEKILEKVQRNQDYTEEMYEKDYE